jgi:hypothetical protein
VKRVAYLAAVILVAATGAGAMSARSLRGNGMTLSLPSAWHGVVGPAGLQAADFPLPRRARSSADVVRVSRGHVHLIVWNNGPWVEYRPHVHSAHAPLVLRKRDLSGPFEGFPTQDAYALRTARLGGDMLEVLADLGPKPLASTALRRVNAVLATLRVLPPRVVRPRSRRLVSDGVALRLVAGWSARMEIPAEHYGGRLVLRAAHGDVHLELVEIGAADSARHVDLPIVLTSRDAIHRGSLTFAHRVFSTGGRSFELDVTTRSAGDLRSANPLLATMTVKPRPWMFRSCDLSLRLPGTWSVAVRPRSGCYPVLKLRGPHVLVVLTELQPGARASGRILRRAGRRFRVAVTPASARTRADAVLSTLRARRRS